ncbi:TPA: CBS domain-containing protein [Pseudomonas aeruginosa]
MKISDIMTRNVQVADPQQSIREAAATMARIDSGALLVGVVSLGNIASCRDQASSATVLQGVAQAHY